MTSDTPIGLLLSGGLDSCILLGRLLQQRRCVRPFYIDCGLAWQVEEADAARQFLEAMATERLEPLVTLQMPLGDLYDGHWSMTGHEAPGATTADEAVYLPGRNALLMIKAVVWCRMHGIEELALGVLQSNPFSDATASFFDHFEAAMNCADGNPVRIVRPLAGLDKRQVMQLGRDLPLQRTFSCIAPSQGRHCGRCNKCAERQTAFRLIGAHDPTRYTTSTKHE
ncbi:MAG TPA: 7-cyano-7-deazaguanine synthase [Thermoguttaceae bacterium]|nr:7-cyano-7-deazaguanine synthase [Thermoguttaceae bacterium]